MTDSKYTWNFCIPAIQHQNPPKKKQGGKWTPIVCTEYKACELEHDTLTFRTLENFSESKEFVSREESKNSFANFWLVIIL